MEFIYLIQSIHIKDALNMLGDGGSPTSAGLIVRHGVQSLGRMGTETGAGVVVESRAERVNALRFKGTGEKEKRGSPLNSEQRRKREKLEDEPQSGSKKEIPNLRVATV